MPPGISSQLQLPVSRRLWIVKVGLVLAFDVALAAAGVGLMVASRSRTPPATPTQAAVPEPSAPRATAPTVEVSRPKVVRKGRRKPVTSSTPTLAPAATPTPAPTPTPPAPPTALPLPAPPTAPIALPASTPIAGSEASAPPDAGPGPAVVPAASAPDAAPPPPDDGRADRIADSIREVVEEHRGQIDRCYERIAKAATRTDPLRGTVTVSLTLQPSGSATDVAVAENDTGSDDLGACLVALLGTWTFPTPGEEPIEFLWPFVFRGN